MTLASSLLREQQVTLASSLLTDQQMTLAQPTTESSTMTSDSRNRFGDKTIIVTGAAGGIGEVYARALAAEGANVVVADLNDDAGKQVAADINGLYVSTDVADEQSAQALAAGGDSFTVFEDGIDVVTGPVDLDAIEAYLAQQDVTTLPAADRITAVE